MMTSTPRRPARILTAVAALVTLAVTSTACSSPDAEPVVATFGDTEVSRAVLDRLVAAQTASVQPPPTDSEVAELRRSLLSALIQSHAMLELARARGIEPSAADIAARWDDEVAAGGGEAVVTEQLAALGLTADDYRTFAIAAQLASEKVIEQLHDELISDDELRAYYDANLQHFVVRDTSHILVDDAGTAASILDRLDADLGNFADLAEEYSTDPGSAATGGNLGPAARGAYVDAFETAVWDAAIGTIVGPVETDYGHHILVVNSEATLSFEDARDKVTSAVADVEVAPVFEQLLRDATADIAIDPSVGAWDSDNGRVVAN